MPRPPQSLHSLRRRLCLQRPLLPQSIHRLRSLPCSHQLPPPHFLHALLGRWCSQRLPPPHSVQQPFKRSCLQYLLSVPHFRADSPRLTGGACKPTSFSGATQLSCFSSILYAYLYSCVGAVATSDLSARFGCCLPLPLLSSALPWPLLSSALPLPLLLILLFFLGLGDRN